eukprot:TRINITY_DN21640_c0_g1_i1.p1 TRINITY_DN21640_c0_g1~~TRINITY_DN21640_c0_g1_i1.p1  ORF type:complete len:239 (+),score=47.00 TRINITY_DN21640_c0_g1_i1:88-804(+)
MIRRPPRSTLSSSSAASDVYKRQEYGGATRFRPFGGGMGNCSSDPVGPDTTQYGEKPTSRRHSKRVRTESLDQDLGRIASEHHSEASSYRAFKVDVRIEGEIDTLKLVVRPFETIARLKARLSFEHKRAAPENSQLMIRDEQAGWIELANPQAKCREAGIAPSRMLKLVEAAKRTESFRERTQRIERERRVTRDRLAKLVTEAENSDAIDVKRVQLRRDSAVPLSEVDNEMVQVLYGD